MPFILPYKGTLPTIHEEAYVSPSATIAGDVHIGAGSSIWFNVAIRGDVHHVRIGENVNIQDGTVCHVTNKKFSLEIGDRVTVGHGAILHGCVLEEESFVGMGAIVMDGARVESGAMVAAGALVSPAKVVKKGELWSGMPARKMRNMTQDEVEYLPWSAEHYRKLGAQYKSES